MAQKVQIIKTDDLENSDVPADETITFALDGTSYEIDLSEKNATELRDTFARYVGAARKVTRGGGGSGRASGSGRSRPTGGGRMDREQAVSGRRDDDGPGPLRRGTGPVKGPCCPPHLARSARGPCSRAADVRR